MNAVVFVSLLSVVPPVPGPVVQRFVAPVCERCAGHRGVSIGSLVGDTVRTPVAGTITFVGDVAGHMYVVVSPDHVRRGSGQNAAVKVTIGWMASLEPTLSAGEHVSEGAVIGVADDTTYLSVRVGGRHVEPLAALGLGWARLRGIGGAVVVRGPVRR